MSPLLDAARDLAELGYHVFPCRPRGKEPITGNGFKAGTRAEREILAWWDKTPDANIGVACGASGIVGVDIDSKLGADPEEVIAELELEGLPVLRTGEAPERCEEYPASLAGLRGAHVLARGSMPTGETAMAGVEIRSVGAYLIVPPSAHPSGVQYLGQLPPVGELPPVPDLSRIAKTNGKGPKAEPVGDVIGANRNTTLTSLAGTMRRRGMSEEAILAGLLEENARRCRPPLSDAEVAKIAKSIAKKAPAAGHRDPSELSDLVIPESILGELAEAGITEEEIAEAKSLKDLEKLLGKKRSVATRLVELVLEAGVELFHDDRQQALATYVVGNHEETALVLSTPFRRYVKRLYHEQEESTPNAAAVADALGVLDAKACTRASSSRCTCGSPATRSASSSTSEIRSGTRSRSPRRAGGSSTGTR